MISARSKGLTIRVIHVIFEDRRRAVNLGAIVLGVVLQAGIMVNRGKPRSD